MAARGLGAIGNRAWRYRHQESTACGINCGNAPLVRQTRHDGIEVGCRGPRHWPRIHSPKRYPIVLAVHSGRWACIPFSIVGAIACYTWARDLYGPKSGILAATLWCFCPNVLAHGQLVAHDVAATSLGLVACYAFWRWLCQPTLKTTATAGVCLGLALLTKMTMLIHFALWPLMWISWCAGRADERRLSRSWLVSGAMLAAILILAIDVLNLGYGFQGSLNSLNSYRFRSHALAGTSDGPGNRFADSVLGELPIPLPCAFLAGLDLQRFSQEGRIGSRGSYLRGEWSAGGTPYYYLYALAIKVPLGTWCLLLLASLVRLCRVDAQNHVRDEVVLLAPAVAILLVASKSAGYADHLRYVLPCFPFVFIWISRLAMRVSTHQSLGKAVIAATVWTALSSLWIYPHSLSFFNEIVGGPRYGHYHLASSNIDYGQDLLKLRSWYDQHPDARPLGLAYWDLDSVDPRLAGLTYYVSPSGTAPSTTVMSHGAKQLGPIPGWHAVNVNTLHGDTWPGRSSYPDWGFYGYFLEFTPVA